MLNICENCLLSCLQYFKHPLYETVCVYHNDAAAVFFRLPFSVAVWSWQYQPKWNVVTYKFSSCFFPPSSPASTPKTVRRNTFFYYLQHNDAAIRCLQTTIFAQKMKYAKHEQDKCGNIVKHELSVYFVKLLNINSSRPLQTREFSLLLLAVRRGGGISHLSLDCSTFRWFFAVNINLKNENGNSSPVYSVRTQEQR